MKVEFVFKICVIGNGGVGKTSTVVALGSAIATFGKKVLLIDMDPQGHCHVRHRHGDI